MKKTILSLVLIIGGMLLSANVWAQSPMDQEFVVKPGLSIIGPMFHDGQNVDPQVCIGDTIEMSVPTSMINVVWHRNGIPIVHAMNSHTLHVVNSGYYTVRAEYAFNMEPFLDGEKFKFVECATGIQQSEQVELTTKLYPNPVQHQLNLESTGENIILVNVYNNLGQVVISTQQQAPLIQLEVSHLETGVYMAEVRTVSGMRQIHKFFVQ